LPRIIHANKGRSSSPNLSRIDRKGDKEGERKGEGEREGERQKEGEREEVTKEKRERDGEVMDMSYNSTDSSIISQVPIGMTGSVRPTETETENATGNIFAMYRHTDGELVKEQGREKESIGKRDEGRVREGGEEGNELETLIGSKKKYSQQHRHTQKERESDTQGSDVTVAQQLGEREGESRKRSHEDREREGHTDREKEREKEKRHKHKKDKKSHKKAKRESKERESNPTHSSSDSSSDSDDSSESEGEKHSEQLRETVKQVFPLSTAFYSPSKSTRSAAVMSIDLSHQSIPYSPSAATSVAPPPKLNNRRGRETDREIDRETDRERGSVKVADAEEEDIEVQYIPPEQAHSNSATAKKPKHSHHVHLSPSPNPLEKPLPKWSQCDQLGRQAIADKEKADKEKAEKERLEKERRDEESLRERDREHASWVPPPVITSPPHNHNQNRQTWFDAMPKHGSK
jgi:hypothetical protein